MLSACAPQEKDDPATEEKKIDLLTHEFSNAKTEIKTMLNAIKQSVKDGDVDKLISFHAYGPKFTEFKDGAPRNGAEENEAYERGVFGSVTEVIKLDFNDLKIAVYDDVANVTFHADFHLKFGEDEAKVNEQITLLLLETANGWKIVHEHHSPLKSTAG
jgi:ketosteroid isomerase-like protein